MAIQQLTQPIINPISAFDSTRAHTISFVVIGGAQGIRNNQTGKEIDNKIQSTMKLEHLIPANTLTNGGYYNAVVYTIDSANNESVASAAVPFYCYSQPNLTIDNIPATETIENGTYKFVGNYLQQENELLNSYQYTLYDSNKNVLSQSALIYYDTDSSLSYTFVGMSNDTAYYIELSGETVNGTKITSGLKYFTVRYIQPASFAICDLVNNCEDGYIQISSNIVAIDGKSNPDPPIYIDDKEVDLRDPNSWVEWNSGFRIQDDFTMRVWGRDFNDYQNIITLTNDINTTSTPNRIELKWMIGDVIKTLPSYTTVEGKSINILDAEAAKIQNLSVGGNLEQKKEDEIDFGTDKFLTMNTDKELPLQVSVLGNSEQETRSGKNRIKSISPALPKTWVSPATGYAQVDVYYDDDFINNYTQGFTIKVKAKNILDKAFSQFVLGNNWSRRVDYISFTQREKDGYKIYELYINNTNFELLTAHCFIMLFEDHSQKTGCDLYDVEVDLGNTVGQDFEAYRVAPSPDYPSEIQTVGSNVNIFDGEIEKGGINYQNGNVESATDRIRSKNFIEVDPNFQYTINRLDSNGKGLGIRGYDKDKNYVGYIGVNTNKTITFIPQTYSNTDMPHPNTKFYYMKFIDLDNNLNARYKIEKGTVATPYSKYGQGCVKVTKCNKNIMPIEIGNNYAYTQNGIKHLNRENGTEVTRFGVKKGQIIKLGLKLISKPTNDTTFSFYFKSSDNNIGSFAHMERNELNQIYEKEYTAIEDGEFFIKIWGSPTPDIFEFQLWAELNTLTDYVKHEEQSYILPTQQSFKSIENIRDIFIKKNSKWYERHNINRKKLDGTENWLMTDGNTRFAIKIIEQKAKIEKKNSTSNLTNCLSNRFIKNTQLDIVKVTNGIAFSQWSDAQYLYLSKFKDNIDELKDYLAANETYVDYPLEIPIDLECTEEQSKILDELNQLEPYYPQTNIYTEENIALINAKYLGSPSPYRPSEIHALGDIKNLINIPEFNVNYTQQYSQSTNTNFILKSDFIYTLSFDYNVNKTNTDLYYSIGYGTNEYDVDLKSNIQYKSLTKGRNSVSFIVPENIPNNATLWVKFAQTIILADINVDISNIQLESGNISTGYEDPNLYNIYPTSASKNLFNYDSPV